MFARECWTLSRLLRLVEPSVTSLIMQWDIMDMDMDIAEVPLLSQRCSVKGLGLTSHIFVCASGIYRDQFPCFRFKTWFPDQFSPRLYHWNSYLVQLCR
mmetsp:Transcript_99233/g.172199  ORF Transcript_99233/g.172199 Transcript_99233/m.172199 type:complete len:99 (-) Transcript_99233:13-309(-)